MSELNDPRVFFAAERTVLAWNRTSLALMAFGFVIERFGLFVQMLAPAQANIMMEGEMAFWIGLAFISLGSIASVTSSLQYRKVLRTLKPIEIPEGYGVGSGVFVNLAVAALGTALICYLFQGHYR